MKLVSLSLSSKVRWSIASIASFISRFERAKTSSPTLTGDLYGTRTLSMGRGVFFPLVALLAGSAVTPLFYVVDFIGYLIIDNCICCVA